MEGWGDRERWVSIGPGRQHPSTPAPQHAPRGPHLQQLHVIAVIEEGEDLRAQRCPHLPQVLQHGQLLEGLVHLQGPAPSTQSGPGAAIRTSGIAAAPGAPHLRHELPGEVRVRREQQPPLNQRLQQAPEQAGQRLPLQVPQQLQACGAWGRGDLRPRPPPRGPAPRQTRPPQCPPPASDTPINSVDTPTPSPAPIRT